MAQFLKITIPWEQRQAHAIEITGNFDAGWGVQVKTANRYACIDRVAELTLTGTKFVFKSLYLNGNGYEFLIKLSNTNYTVVTASSTTIHEVVNMGSDFSNDSNVASKSNKIILTSLKDDWGISGGA